MDLVTYALCKKFAESSGSGLPDVTTADNGKILGVENGAWGKIPGVYVVTGTATTSSGGTWTSGYSWEALVNAFMRGATVQVRINGITFANVQFYMNDVLSLVLFLDGAGVGVDLYMDGTFTIATL